MVKTCKKCGAILKDEAEFCDECGTKVDTPIKAPNYTNMKVPKSHKKLKIVGIIVAIILIIIVAGVLITDHATATYNSENYTATYPYLGTAEYNSSMNMTNFYDENGLWMGSISVKYEPDYTDFQYQDYLTSNGTGNIKFIGTSSIDGHSAFEFNRQENSEELGNRELYICNYDNKTGIILLNKDNPESQNLLNSIKLK